MTTSYETLITERDGQIGIISVNRPKALNALSRQVLTELPLALREMAYGADAALAIIITGAGEKAFVAGADISAMAPLAPWQAQEFATLGHALGATLEALPCVTIAAINGYALGGGLELAMSCDLIYASEAARVGQPEVNLGVVPGFGGTQRLTRLVGKSRAKEMVFTGDMYDAAKAKEIGLVLEVLPKDKLIPHCKEVGRKIASKGPLAIAAAKRLIEAGFDLPLAAANRLEADTFALLFGTTDQKEGMAAFLEKRPAKFTGT